jgi:hypothetical protein
MSQCTATNRGGKRCDSPQRVTALDRTLNPIAVEKGAQIIVWMKCLSRILPGMPFLEAETTPPCVVARRAGNFCQWPRRAITPHLAAIGWPRYPELSVLRGCLRKNQLNRMSRAAGDKLGTV